MGPKLGTHFNLSYIFSNNARLSRETVARLPPTHANLRRRVIVPTDGLANMSPIDDRDSIPDFGGRVVYRHRLRKFDPVRPPVSTPLTC
jgi:hypothetical protein